MVFRILYYPRMVSQMTLVEFANYCGVSKTIIYNLEHGIPVSRASHLKIMKASVKLLEKDEKRAKKRLTQRST